MNLKIYNSQVSGKKAKLIDAEDESILLKEYTQQQVKFYQYIDGINCLNPAIQIKPYLPKYLGRMQFQNAPSITDSQTSQKASQNQQIWLAHLKDRYKVRDIETKFIRMQNLTFGFNKPNIFDIKVGISYYDKTHNIIKNTDHSHLKLNGCTIEFPFSGNAIFLSKYILKQVNETNQFLLHLALYFYNGQKIILPLLNCMIDKLKQIYLCLKVLTQCYMMSVSVCLFYDALNPQKNYVKLLDFDRVTFKVVNEHKNKETCLGISSLIQFLIKILNNHQILEDLLPKKLQTLIKQSSQSCIPQSRLKKYECNNKINYK